MRVRVGDVDADVDDNSDDGDDDEGERVGMEGKGLAILGFGVLVKFV